LILLPGRRSQTRTKESNYRKDAALYLHLFSSIMQAIKIIKANKSEAPTENKKLVEPSTRKIANTVKSWIEESQQRRRNISRGFTRINADQNLLA
jgi:hypothetical protein